MSVLAKTYIGLICALGTTVLVGSTIMSRVQDPQHFLMYLLAAVLSSGMKIALPSIPGTLSVNFIFILISVSQLSFLEALTVGCAAILWQYLWKTEEKRNAIKIIFNLCSTVLSVAACTLAYVQSDAIFP